MTPLAAFNPRPHVERVALMPGQYCYVIDDALTDPERLVEFAASRRDAFRPVDFNAYPGILLPTPEVNAALNEFFAQHIRSRFDARRVVHMHSRLALVTMPPQSLQPRQRLPHRDSVGVEPGHSIQASVLYLFHDPAFGGTSFYASRLSAADTARLFHDASTLTAGDFAQRHAIAPRYMTDSDEFFAKVATIPARWNRLIFYDGSVLHSGDIGDPEKLSADPLSGRLTLNGFFTCRRKAA